MREGQVTKLGTIYLLPKLGLGYAVPFMGGGGSLLY